MKKLFLVIFALALLTITTNKALAASCDANTDKFTNGGVCITTNGTFIPDQSGGTQVVYERYTTAGTNNSLTATETGKHLTDTGGCSGLTPNIGCGGSKHILPRAAPGLNYTICSGARITVTVDTLDTSDLIEHSISGTNLDAGDSLKNNGQAGECLTVFSSVANKWTVMPTPANWVDNGTN